MVEKRVGPSDIKGRAERKNRRKELAKMEMQRARHFIKKGRAQRQVRGKRQTRRRQENRKMQSSIKPEAEVDMGDKK